MQPRGQNNTLKTFRAGLQALGIYAGSISSAGVISNGPTGWTASGPASSVFTVTHGLALTANSYNVIATVTGATAGVAMITTRATNTFTVTTSDLATPTVGDRAFDFFMFVGDGE